MKALTTMQAAYWVGRQTDGPLSGVAAHLYAEFDREGMQVAPLEKAVRALFQQHSALRLQVSPAGEQSIAPLNEHHCLQLDDWRAESASAIAQGLESKRYAKSQQKLALDQGVACEISLTLLPDDRSRLHIDVDMIACDGVSFRILVEALADYYHQLPPTPQDLQASQWLQYLALNTPDAERRSRARLWWQSQLATMPPAPRPLAAPGPCRSNRLALQLSALHSAQLSRLARQHHLTLSALFLALFALSVSHGWKMTRFRLNVPMFFREPLMPAVDNIIGDFSEVLLLAVEIRAGESLVAFTQRLMAQLAELISHADYPGVSVARDLSRLHGNVQSTPIVFTAGFGIQGRTLFSPQVKQTLGELSWVISQGPEVMLDAQVAHHDDGILINWDVREDAFPAGTLPRLLACWQQLLHLTAWHQPGMTLPVGQLLARATPQAWQQQQPLRDLLLRLLSRMNIHTDAEADLRQFNLSPEALMPLRQVLEKYLRVSLSEQELRDTVTISALAAEIHARQPASPQAAEKLLAALAA
ncbi:condensation domain-containing protein [Pantoea sp. A4]|uniref:condensation domain-containing protein n=1 Tax=Pantoea sp. A4 TaxID=1225184 RepID=UPI000368A8CF|nr:condensation domain-containing protein [Pantoea sp. A4]